MFRRRATFPFLQIIRTIITRYVCREPFFSISTDTGSTTTDTTIYSSRSIIQNSEDQVLKIRFIEIFISYYRVFELKKSEQLY